MTMAYDAILLPNMKKLGLDPAKVKYILITHGHGPDHVGGVQVFQRRLRHKGRLEWPEWQSNQMYVRP